MLVQQLRDFDRADHTDVTIVIAAAFGVGAKCRQFGDALLYPLRARGQGLRFGDGARRQYRKGGEADDQRRAEPSSESVQGSGFAG